MPISEQFQDDAIGGVDLDSHAANSSISFGGFSGGMTSNHAAFILIAVGIVGLWIVARVFKGA